MKDIILRAQITEDEHSERLLKIAEQKGLILPHPALGIFGTPLYSVETRNGNDVRLSKEGTEQALQTIVHTQINPNHNRADTEEKYIFGHTIHAELQENGQVFIAFVFYKDIFPEEYKKAQELLAKKELFVSWEITADLDTQEMLADGSRRIHNFAFLGTGLLYGVTPAYDEAIVEINVARKNIPEKDPELMFAKKLIEKSGLGDCGDLPTKETPYEQKIYIVTSTDEDHWHVSMIDMEGNGETINIYGEDTTFHTHKIVNWQFQEADGHAHKIRDEIWAELKKVIKNEFKDVSKFNKQGGKPEMTEEQKKQVAELREKFGELAKDMKDEDLLDEAKVAELEKAQKDSEEKAQETKTDLEKAQEENEALKSKVAELEATIEAHKSEVEKVRENAEKIGKLKVELKDNKYVAEFSDEDYLDEGKVERAKIQKENDDLKAQNEELMKKAQEKAEEKDEKAEKQEEHASKNEEVDTDTGNDETKEDKVDFITSARKKAKEARNKRLGIK